MGEDRGTTGVARLRLTLLGTVEVARGDAVVPVPGARLRGLLVRLALVGGRTVEPDALVEAIWGEDLPADPAHALQTLVSRLRRALGAADSVEQVGGGYRLAVEADVDALRFERLAVLGGDRLRASDPRSAAAALDEALTLWAGRPGDEPAAVVAVAPAVGTRLARLSVEAVADLAAAELALGRAEAAAARLSEMLTDHPVHERAAALLMDALAGQGRQAEALTLYERVRETLADELGIDPGTALRERHLRLLRTQQSTPASEPEPGNLPTPLTSFLGRADDLDRIRALFTAGRLVTVFGPGGAGKTRLAVEAARRCRDEYRDGCWMVDLASVTLATEVGAAVLTAVGPRGPALFEAPERLHGNHIRELDLLVDRLDGREILLLVDNCEQVIDAVASLLSPLLTRCPELRVLATSREPLAIDGEGLVPLGPLTLPEPNADVAQARRTASVRLFTERAAAVRPGFEVGEHNLDAVLRIVRSLDGMPLALELGAVRLRTLSLAAVDAGLSDRFRLLASGSRTAVERHRTLRAAIAWSWDLLDADARTLAERISVLPGGITPGSAVAVCAGTAVSSAEIPELLAGLVDRSLLQLAPDGRYRMLETIREYGLQSLNGRATAVRELSARYFAALVARYDPALRGPEQLGALRVLRAEYDNVLAALRQLCDSGDADRAIGLAVNLSWFWQMLGRHNDAAYWLREAVPGSATGPRAKHDLVLGLRLNIIATQHVSVTESVDELPALADRILHAPTLPGFGGSLLALRLAAMEPTRTASETMQRLIDGPDVWLSGLARMFRAHIAENEGRLDQVRADVTAALECFARTGDRWGRAQALPLRALLRQYDGDLGGALGDLSESVLLARAFGTLDLADEIFIDLRRIDLHLRLGETTPAAESIAAARGRAPHSMPTDAAILLDTWEALLQRQIGDPGRARELIESAEAAVSKRLSGSSKHVPALVAAARAALCLESNDGPGAERALDRAYSAAVDSRDMPIVATVALTVADLARFHGRYRDSAVLLGAAARLRGAHDPTDLQVHELSGRGSAELGAEQFAEAYESGWQLDVPTALNRVAPARLRGPEL
ncbi:BTAD domain-containing putative transcriptional regulator [Nocardia heshunensis]